MFDFMDMIGTYDLRKVDHFKADRFMVDTCAVTDGSQPFETAVSHPEYGYGTWVIVEAYDTKEEAQAGHDKWVGLMTNEPLPEVLQHCRNSTFAALIFTAEELAFPRVR